MPNIPKLEAIKEVVWEARKDFNKLMPKQKEGGSCCLGSGIVVSLPHKPNPLPLATFPNKWFQGDFPLYPVRDALQKKYPQLLFWVNAGRMD